MPCLTVGRLRAHKMGELKGDLLVILSSFGGLQFEPQLIKFERKKFDGHIAVESLSICPAFHSIFIGQLLIHLKEGIQFIIINMSVLKSTGVYYFVYTRKYFTPFFLMLLHRYGFFF